MTQEIQTLDRGVFLQLKFCWSTVCHDLQQEMRLTMQDCQVIACYLILNETLTLMTN